MKPCPKCGAENHDQAVECKSCLRPFGGYVAGRVAAPPPPAAPVRIMDIDMPFGSMVGFMVKWAIASIPAIFILVVIGLFLAMLLTSAGIVLGGI